jgi:hypothetical protein
VTYGNRCRTEEPGESYAFGGWKGGGAKRGAGAAAARGSSASRPPRRSGWGAAREGREDGTHAPPPPRARSGQCCCSESGWLCSGPGTRPASSPAHPGSACAAGAAASAAAGGPDISGAHTLAHSVSVVETRSVRSATSATGSRERCLMACKLTVITMRFKQDKSHGFARESPTRRMKRPATRQPAGDRRPMELRAPGPEGSLRSPPGWRSWHADLRTPVQPPLSGGAPARQRGARLRSSRGRVP